MCVCVCVCVCLCVCVCVCVCMCVCGCMVQWFVQSISSRNIVGSIPAEYGFTRLSSPSLSLGGYQQPNVYVWVCMVDKKKEKKRKKEKKGIVAGQQQPLGPVWCKTRLFNSGGQFDQLCNLIGGAILARSTMLAHSQAIIAYGDGRPRSKVCVSVCVCLCLWCCGAVCARISVQ